MSPPEVWLQFKLPGAMVLPLRSWLAAAVTSSMWLFALYILIRELSPSMCSLPTHSFPDAFIAEGNSSTVSELNLIVLSITPQQNSVFLFGK